MSNDRIIGIIRIAQRRIGELPFDQDLALPVHDNTAHNNKHGQAQRHGKAMPQRQLTILLRAKGGAEVLVKGRRERLGEYTQHHGQGGKQGRGEPQPHGDRMHLGDGLCRLRAINLLLGSEGAPQKTQRIGHGEDRAEDIGHQHHIARHAGE